MKKIENFIKPFLKKDLPDVRPGDEVRVSQKIREGEKERSQIFEGTVIARSHKKEVGATIIVRREISGIGVERIFPLHLPTIEKIEILVLLVLLSPFLKFRFFKSVAHGGEKLLLHRCPRFLF